MMAYIITLLVSLFLCKYSKKLYIIGFKDKNDISFIYACFPFLLNTVLRYNVGTDYLSYTVFYYNYGGVKTDQVFERLFDLIIKISNYLEWPRFIIISLGIIFCIGIFISIYSMSENKILSIILLMISGLYFYSLTMMRQCVSLVFFILSLNKCIDRKYVQTFCLVLISIGFHTTGFVYLIFYILLFFYEKIFCVIKSKKVKVFILVLAFLSITLFPSIIRETIQRLSLHTGIYDGYFNSIDDAGNTSITHFLFGIVPLIALIVALLFDKNAFKKGNHVFNIFMICAILSAIFTILMPFIPNGERMIFLFSPIGILSVPYFINRIHNKYIRQATLLLCCSLWTLGTIYYFYIGKALMIIPYKNIFFK